MPNFFSKKTPLLFTENWKQLKGKNSEGKNFRKLLGRKQSSAKISKISRNPRKSSENAIFYLLTNLLKYLLRTLFLPRSSQKCLPFAFYPVALCERSAPKCPQYCWEFHAWLWEALSGTTSEKRSAPSRTGGEINLEMLWKPQMP